MPKEIYIDENGNERILSSSPSALSGLLDTDITTPSANQVLAYDSNGKVVNTTIYKSGQITIGEYVAGGYVSGSGNYAEISFPIMTKATSGTVDQLSSDCAVFFGSSRVANPFTVANSSILSIENNLVRLELRFATTQTANIACTVLLKSCKITLT